MNLQQFTNKCAARQSRFVLETCRTSKKLGHVTSVCLGWKPPEHYHTEMNDKHVEKEKQEMYKIQTHASDKFSYWCQRGRSTCLNGVGYLGRGPRFLSLYPTLFQRS